MRIFCLKLQVSKQIIMFITIQVLNILLVLDKNRKFYKGDNRIILLKQKSALLKIFLSKKNFIL